MPRVAKLKSSGTFVKDFSGQILFFGPKEDADGFLQMIMGLDKEDYIICPAIIEVK